MKVIQRQEAWKTTRIARAPALVLPTDGAPEARCYARVIGPCRGGISGEHPSSNQIVQRLADEGDGRVRVSGLHWLVGDERKRVGPSSLVMNVLCRDHNSSLSPIDVVGSGVFEAFLRLLDKRLSGSEEVWLWGPDFERWMLKALCARTVGGDLQDASLARAPRVVPVEWTRAVFGLGDLPPGAGMYFTASEEHFADDESSLSLQSHGMFDSDDASVVGFRAVFARIGSFTLLTGPRHKEDPLDAKRYRPNSVMFRGPRSLRLRFGWPPLHRGGDWTVTWYPRGARPSGGEARRTQ